MRPEVLGDAKNTKHPKEERPVLTQWLPAGSTAHRTLQPWLIGMESCRGACGWNAAPPKVLAAGGWMLGEEANTRQQDGRINRRRGTRKDRWRPCIWEGPQERG